MAMSNETGSISKKIFSVYHAGNLKNVSDAYKLVQTLLNTLATADVSFASGPMSTIQSARAADASHGPNTFHIQISIFERSMS